MRIALLMFILFFVAAGCGDKKDEEKNSSAPDENSLFDKDNLSSDNENNGQNDSDKVEISDFESDLEHDVDISNSDTDSTALKWEEELPKDFITPSKGFTLRIGGTVYDPQLVDGKTDFIEAAFNLDEQIYDISSEKYSYISSYKTTTNNKEYDMFFINASQGKNSDNTSFYSAMIYGEKKIFEQAKTENINKISGMSIGSIIYKNDFSGNNSVSCPVAVFDRTNSSFYIWYKDATMWSSGEEAGFALNSAIKTDLKSIISYFSASKYYETCTCYDNNTLRTCNADDANTPPNYPVNIMPLDGEENASFDATLSWKGSDPEGGELKFDFYFGNSPETMIKLLDKVTETAYKPSNLEVNKTYYWKVVVYDSKNLSAEGKIWSFSTKTTEVIFTEHNFLIVAEKELETGIDSALQQYIADISNLGIKPYLFYWQPTSAEMLKKIIKKNYELYSIKGALLVGNIPAAWYEENSNFGQGLVMFEEFPSDYFLMDIDGEWDDKDSNGIYDSHPPLSLEIFTSRLIGSADEINIYFDRVAQYRKNGSFFNPRTFFSFVDDDWNKGGFSTDKTWDLESIYKENYFRLETEENTSKTTYLNRMQAEGGEYVYQWIHSDPQTIYFNENFSSVEANLLAIDEIRTKELKGSFFNLFNCSISRFTEEKGNMATEYLHSQLGLATLGSTKTGGIFNPEIFNKALAQGTSWGESYRLWVNDTFTNYANYGFSIEYIDAWWLGMMVQGDPFITLTKKPETRAKITSNQYFTPEIQNYFSTKIVEDVKKTGSFKEYSRKSRKKFTH